ncbi:hypothetical protein BDK51DRAFT_52924, partial [Blyttiomyces helicus]
MHFTKIVSLLLIAGAASAIGRPTYSDSEPIEVEDSQVATLSTRSLLRHKSSHLGGLRHVSHLLPGHHLVKKISKVGHRISGAGRRVGKAGRRIAKTTRRVSKVGRKVGHFIGHAGRRVVSHIRTGGVGTFSHTLRKGARKVGQIVQAGVAAAGTGASIGELMDVMLLPDEWFVVFDDEIVFLIFLRWFSWPPITGSTGAGFPSASAG